MADICARGSIENIAKVIGGTKILVYRSDSKSSSFWWHTFLALRLFVTMVGRPLRLYTVPLIEMRRDEEEAERLPLPLFMVGRASRVCCGFLKGISDFDFGPLLHEAVCREQDVEYDVEDTPEPPDALPQPPVDDFDTIDECSPIHPPPSPPSGDSPPDKRTRLEDAWTTLVIYFAASQAGPGPQSCTCFAASPFNGAYSAKVEDKEDKYGSKKCRTLPEMLVMEFRLVPWDGFEARPLVDSKGRIIAVLASQPRDPTYAASVQAAYCALVVEATAAHFPASLAKHRRGPFVTLNIGLSYSKGQRIPSRLDGGIYASLLSKLLGNKHFIRSTPLDASADPPCTAAFALLYLATYLSECLQNLGAWYPIGLEAF
ncbi:hypothetical protein C8R44DRAFT_733838 [Mycena epipterygia]|nr:hypothetical protein C8R44DRAFT_733838 [Mycena epipterygia]